MKRFTQWLAAVLIFGMSSVLYSAPLTYVTTLNGANENPPSGSVGTGSATVIIDTSAHTLQVITSFSALTGATTAAHIHCCIAPPGNAGVATMLPSFSGFPLAVTSGNYNNTFDLTQAGSWNAAYITANGGTPATAEAALANGLAAANAYLNIHTTLSPGGEIRGFLSLAPVSVKDVPTLGEEVLILLAIMLMAVAVSVMRRRGSLH